MIGAPTAIEGCTADPTRQRHFFDAWDETMKAMAKVTDWIRRNDPMGGTVKGVIVAVFGVIFIAAGGLWLGVTFIVAGLLLFALPLWMARRNRHRLGHVRNRIGRS